MGVSENVLDGGDAAGRGEWQIHLFVQKHDHHARANRPALRATAGVATVGDGRPLREWPRPTLPVRRPRSISLPHSPHAGAVAGQLNGVSTGFSLRSGFVSAVQKDWREWTEGHRREGGIGHRENDQETGKQGQAGITDRMVGAEGRLSGGPSRRQEDCRSSGSGTATANDHWDVRRIRSALAFP